MRVLATRAGAAFRAGRGIAFFALAAEGCSLLLAHDPWQCERDSDCAALGLRQTTCDTASRVCRANSSGGADAGGGTGGLGQAGKAGMPMAGLPEGGAAGAGATESEGGSPVAPGGSTGLAGAADSGGMTTGGEGGTAPIPPWPGLDAPGNGIRVRVRSFCNQSLRLRVSNNTGPLAPDHSLGNGEELDYVTPSAWPGGVIAAYAADTDALEMVTLTVQSGISYYSAHYIDGLGLPVEAQGFGGDCSSAKTFGCYARESAVKGCAEPFLKRGERCLSAGRYCQVPANASLDYCHVLDSKIAGCAACPKGSTTEVYAGSGKYSDMSAAKFGAALNRGVVAQPDSSDASAFYQNPPYNSYASWVHSLCPNMMAFTHDDYNSTLSFVAACSATELRVTFCPGR